MKLPSSGCITISSCLLAPDGGRYFYFYSKNWFVLTDAAIKEMEMPQFSSREGWFLAAYGEDDKLKIIIPGCRIEGFTACDRVPEFKDIYEVK